MKTIKKHLIHIVGIIVGLAGGYLYYKFVGCRTGGCAITSNPFMSMLWGAAVGYLLSDSIKGFIKPKTKQESE